MKCVRTFNHGARRPRRSARRGVLLLVVLSLLVLFAVVGMTFVLLTAQYRRISQGDVLNEERGDNYRKQLDDVAMQIFRDTTNTNSALSDISLLGGIYGLEDPVNGSLRAKVKDSSYVAGGQLIDITVNAIPQQFTNHKSAGYFNGCVLTVLNGDLAGQSTRILGYSYTPALVTLRVMAFSNSASKPSSKDQFLINGHPFNGTGFGFNGVDLQGLASDPKLFHEPDLLDSSNSNRPRKLPAALLPNYHGPMGEPYSDLNQNGVWNSGEPFVDLNNNSTRDADFSGDKCFGGVNVDYTAPDLQHMLLGFQPPGRNTFLNTTSSTVVYDSVEPFTDTNNNGVYDSTPSPPEPFTDLNGNGVHDTFVATIPSLHRWDLVKYWLDLSITWQSSPPSYVNNADPVKQAYFRAKAWDKLIPIDLRRAITMRPLGTIFPDINNPSPNLNDTDHPNFTGSNPNYNPINGTLDVDNDGDSVPESIWVDAGLPVQTLPDGRKVKPLVAVLCLDMDGRLNVNAHSSPAQVQQHPYQQLTDTTFYKFFAGNTAGSVITMPRGQGYGPADISLASILPSTQVRAALMGGKQVGGTSWDGRYGEFSRSGSITGGLYPDTWTATAAPPLPGDSLNHNSMSDNLAGMKQLGIPNKYSAGTPSSYGTPSDLWGRGMVAVDWRGQPLWLADDRDSESTNDPYVFNLSRSAVRASQSSDAVDNPFTISELDRILRSNDIGGTQLPGRLRALLASGGSLTPAQWSDLGRLLTTESYDLPTPSVQATADMIAGVNPTTGGADSSYNYLSKMGKPPAHLTMVDLLRYKMKANGASDSIIDGPTGISALLPPEIIAGKRFDLNRPFGNGVDDDNNGVADEAAEYTNKKEAATYPNLSAYSGVSADLDGDGTISTATTAANEGLRARQQYARYLYVMMMLLSDQGKGSWQWATEGTLSEPQKKELTARRIAQWAVNVVDYRDADSAMTPFEFDLNPFDGWDVDDDYTTADTSADRRLVWGAEYPDLLLTETTAFHDRRVRDTNNEKAGGKKVVDPATTDTTLDQVRVPQGSAFFELYCTRSANGTEAALPGDLYKNGQLDLGKVSPDGKNPVWRLAITVPINPSNPSDPNNVVAGLSASPTGHPDSTTLQPYVDSVTGKNQFNALYPSSVAQVERFVWLAPGLTPNSAVDNDGSPIDGRTYCNNNTGTTALLPPGCYAVVGPRQTTYVGRKTGTQPTAMANQKIVIDPTSVVPTDVSTNPTTTGFGHVPTSGTSNYPASTGTSPPRQIRPTLGIICDARPTNWSDPKTNGVASGVNVSEPLFSATNYYPEPSLNDDGTTTAPLEKYGKEPGPPYYPDQPFDDDPAASPKRPVGQAMPTSNGTLLNYRTVFLQRLADPLKPFDKSTNPYLTVDFMPIDLTVFNGEEAPPSSNDPYPATSGYKFAARTRGLLNNHDRNLWSPITADPVATSAAAAGTDVFNYDLVHQLGYLNASYGTPWPGPPAPTPGSLPDWRYLGCPNPSDSGFNGTTFPWLNWPNRPLISALELMQVPASSPGRLPLEFGLAQATGSPYDLATMAQGLFSANPWWPAAPGAPAYSHLLNFFAADQTEAKAPHYYRLFDFVEVPSRFVDTETVLNPTVFTAGGGSNGLQAPFNRISKYRDPGKVNLNTISDKSVFAGVFPQTNQPLTLDQRWKNFLDSRAGGDIGASGAAGPSKFFSNPFRSPESARYSVPASSGAPQHPKGVEVSLLRPQDPLANGTNPLFDFVSTTNHYEDTSRNPYFRFQEFQRMSNLVTTRSNVYAVWITVGYFEAEPIPSAARTAHGAEVKQIYPDGFAFGREIGADTGEVTRHRAFYIFDRSIPVGYERGQDHNVESAILLKRFIE